MAPWVDLLDDLVATIAKRVLLLEDFIAFGAVCRSWKSAATRKNFTSTHQVPWLMLSETEGTTVRDFNNLKNGKVYHLNMPELIKGDVMCYSSLGWLMTLSSDFKVDLLHPFNGTHIELPSIETFINQHSDEELESIAVDRNFIVSKFVLSSNPSLTSDYTVVIKSLRRLAFCKAGHREWTAIDCKIDEEDDVCDIACYKGKVYMVDTLGSIFVCEIEDGKQPKTRVVVRPLPSQLDDISSANYLVDSAGALLLVERSVGETPLKFRVHEVPLNAGDWSKSTEVPNLRNKTIFLSSNDSSFCVESSDYYGCKSNCIYFREYSRSFGSFSPQAYEIHHMEDGIIESSLGETHESGKCANVLIEPSF